MEKPVIHEFEARRLFLQRKLDAQKKAAERNRMGQFATPQRLSLDILRYAKEQLGEKGKLRFLDPAIGTGSFYSALLGVFPKQSIEAAVGYEIDPHYGSPAGGLWRETGLDIRLEDFTKAEAPKKGGKFDLLICNPPYVRHHHIPSQEKRRLKLRTIDSCGVEIGGLAGLYCYFLCLSHAWLRDGGLAGWLIPSEFMDVNYGVAVKRYLLEKVRLLHIHRFDPNDVQFGDALVSSTVVWFRKEPTNKGHKIRFTHGGSLLKPAMDRSLPVEILRHDPKWTQYPMRESHAAEDQAVLADFFEIKRGLATGNNSFFILPIDEIEQRKLPMEAFKPILPSPRYIPDDEIQADENGNPFLERKLFLLNAPWTEKEIEERYPTLRRYLEEGKAEGVAKGYLCQHRKRWYAQENRPPAPFVCTYLGRKSNKNGRHFRFILNNSQATAANVYLMLYPKPAAERAMREKPGLNRQIWKLLNQIQPQTLLGEGRVYGGGLHKLEPRELGNVPAGSISDLLPSPKSPKKSKQLDMFSEFCPQR